MDSDKRVQLKEQLKSLIIENGILVDDSDSGNEERKKYGYSLGNIITDPKGVNLIGELLLEEVSKYNPLSVGGIDDGTIHISTAIAMRSHRRKMDEDIITAFYVRSEVKPDQPRNKIEGELADPIVVVGDIITDGLNIMKAIDTITERKHNVAGVVAVIDAEEDNILKGKVKYSALFKHSDFKDHIEERMNKIK